eukprot:CAMPEP_0115251004 /NCGR_PEP_ID=MMETSP0270-20121206/43403_1 /TAXON_ID=71861 /ORGANISM="Scrippsiella trochoidea, Strain CCMP3099" /LENGTH=119 /DNA_ID=CAMNT_0002666405 /DNA_START=334 /DNA_END=689 /DNA_ORIENTATION=+
MNRLSYARLQLSGGIFLSSDDTNGVTARYHLPPRVRVCTIDADGDVKPKLAALRCEDDCGAAAAETPLTTAVAAAAASVAMRRPLVLHDPRLHLVFRHAVREASPAGAPVFGSKTWDQN